MNEYDFILKFALPGEDADPETFLTALEEAGCDDALIGIGKKGRIALDFTRAAKSSTEAVLSALRDVRKAIPGARFIQAEPDLVGLTDVAEIAGCSRQNIRRVTISDVHFPAAVHEGNPELFHLSDVLTWLERRGTKGISTPIDNHVLMEIAETNRQVNLAKQINELPHKKLDPEFQEACEA